MIREITKDTLEIDRLRKSLNHKYDYGHLLVLSGGAGKTGAARLAARGALRIGAGLVTLAAPREACPEIAARITALMLRPLDTASGLKTILEDNRINALAVGPGFGLEQPQAEMTRAVLAARRPTVLDADALTLISRNPDLFNAMHPHCVLTPHDGEFARLFPDLSLPKTASDADIRQSMLEEAAARAGCCILLKGADTVIAAPDDVTSVHRARGASSAPWLATAGSGDVLTGFAAGLLARGMTPFQAATHAAWLHAASARAFGPGLIAEDIPEMLPTVFGNLFD